MPVDQRARKLAKIAVNYCIEAKPKQKIILTGDTESIPFLIELYKEVLLKGAYPSIKFKLPNSDYFFFKHAKPHQLKFFPKNYFEEIKDSNAFINIYTTENTRNLTSIDPKKISTREKVLSPISNYIANSKPKMKRVTIAFPCQAHAQEADMSLEEWEEFVYNACLIDWKKFSKKLEKINRKFEKGKEVHLIGKNVDLKFSIAGRNSVYDDGKENMPGGEIFMAPVRESLNGFIKFEYPRIYSGKRISGVFLRFKNGKVVEYDAEENKPLLKAILNTDKNSKYIGEFGIGMNPRINRYSNNLLFDEKISGTIHLALGMAYKENGGGNDSSVHVDIVKDMSYSSIILDGKVVQQNGKWK